MIELNGTCEPEFEPVKQAFIKGFDNGLEVGASVAVFREGEPVVDLWAGYKDAKKTAPWEEDTVIFLASTTKIPTGLCAHIVREHDYRFDEVVGMPVRRGLGLGLNSEEFACPSEQSIHWGGRGGSMCVMDLASKTSLAYVPNNWIEVINEDPRNEAIRLAYNKIVGN